MALKTVILAVQMKIIQDDYMKCTVKKTENTAEKHMTVLQEYANLVHVEKQQNKSILLFFLIF